MRLALLIALTRDRRSAAVVLGEIKPIDQVLIDAKKLITDNVCPDPRFPVLRVATLDNIQREHVFRVTPEQIAAFQPEALVPASDETAGVLALNEKLSAELEAQKTEQAQLREGFTAEYQRVTTELESYRSDALSLKAQLEESVAANARAIAALGEAQEAAKLSAARIAELEAESKTKADEKAAAASAVTTDKKVKK